MKFFQYFKSCLRAIFCKKISQEIKHREIIVRSIYYSHHIKKNNTLKREAFINKSGVSCLRWRYTSINFCKKNALKLSKEGKKFRGFGTLTQEIVNYINRIEKMKAQAYIKVSPMDEFGNYRKDVNIYKCDKGLPMHVDFLFKDLQISTEEVNTSQREFANELIKLVKFHPDRTPDNPQWGGDRLTCCEIPHIS